MALQEFIQISSRHKMDSWNFIQIDSRIKKNPEYSRNTEIQPFRLRLGLRKRYWQPDTFSIHILPTCATWAKLISRVSRMIHYLAHIQDTSDQTKSSTLCGSSGEHRNVKTFTVTPSRLSSRGHWRALGQILNNRLWLTQKNSWSASGPRCLLSKFEFLPVRISISTGLIAFCGNWTSAVHRAW